MKRLSKSQIEEKNRLLAKLDNDKSELEDEIYKFNELIQEAFSRVENARDVYNETLNDLRNFRDEIVLEMEETISERSEKWLESEIGSNYTAWKGSWEDLGLDDVVLNGPELIDSPNEAASSETFSDVSDSPEEN